jgi:hypothetical protein
VWKQTKNADIGKSRIELDFYEKLNLEEKMFKFSSQLNYNGFTFEFLHLGKSKPFPHCDVCVI